MREILFRGQTKSDKKWIYGNLLQTDNGTYIIQNYAPFEGIGKYEVDHETICQYTGLTDKNGRKIFEGDIVKIPLFKPDTMAIGFIEGAFCLVNSKQEYVADIHYIHHAGVNQTEIIGNIFDNPELIGEQP